MKVFKKIESLQKKLSLITSKQTLGFVPTMGALHQGHLALVKRAQKENDFVIVSIFINPTQFDKKKDLTTYPKTVEQDLELLENHKCDFVFVPNVKEMYSEKIESAKFNFEGLDKVMEGKFRAGHFDGVGTIVKKFLEIIKPTKAYFGEKDFQQLQIIKKMVLNTKLPVQIIPCAIFREEDGLAMSSRNKKLSVKERKKAPFIYKTLTQAKILFQNKDIDIVKKMVKKAFENNPVLKLEYFEIADIKTLNPTNHKEKGKKYRAFIAVFADEVRLIDNIALN